MIDLQHITHSSLLYNFHTHTQFCDGRAPMEKFVEEAIEQEFKSLGFSPHAPIPAESPCNMTQDEVPVYLEEIKRLQALYGDKIAIYASMEIDYLDEAWGPANAYFVNLPLDYRIGSVHFLPNPIQAGAYVDVDGSPEGFITKMDKFFNNDITQVVKAFFAQSVAMVEHGGFDVIGHFDKIGYNANCFQEGIEREAWYRKLVLNLIDAIMDYHLIIEINTKAWLKKQRMFPNLDYFALLKKYETPIVVNSDAHEPSLLNAGRMEALKFYSSL